MDFTDIPIISTNRSLVNRIQTAIKNTDIKETTTPLIQSLDEGLDYFNINLPNLFFLDISNSKVKPFKFLSEVKKDPWLMHGGMIVLASKYNDISKLDDFKGANFLISMTYNEIENQLPKVLTILKNNANIVVQRAIGEDFIGNISGSFTLNNDVTELNCYTNLICNFLYNTNKIGKDQKTKLTIIITELLLNAIEHGNCEISYNEPKLLS